MVAPVAVGRRVRGRTAGAVVAMGRFDRNAAGEGEGERGGEGDRQGEPVGHRSPPPKVRRVSGSRAARLVTHVTQRADGASGGAARASCRPRAARMRDSVARNSPTRGAATGG